MKKHHVKHSKRRKEDLPVAWLPVDSRIFFPMLSFGRIQGLSQLFLEIELLLSVIIVVGTLLMVAIRLFT